MAFVATDTRLISSVCRKKKDRLANGVGGETCGGCGGVGYVLSFKKENHFICLLCVGMFLL